MKRWVDSREADQASGDKRPYYMSIEFLLGRMLYNNALSLLCTPNYTQALNELGMDWKDIVYEEPEPGLGNGGLPPGRLLPGFPGHLDMPAMGCTIRYEYGLFRQKLTGGQQVELPDNWLDNGNVWEVADMENVFDICFEGEVATEIRNGRTTFTLINPGWWRRSPMTCRWWAMSAAASTPCAPGGAQQAQPGPERLFQRRLFKRHQGERPGRGDLQGPVPGGQPL